MKSFLLNFFLFLFIIQFSTSAYSQQSVLSQSGPNAKALGEDNNYADCKDAVGHWRKPECRIFNFSQTDRTLTARSMIPSKDPLNFKFMQNPPAELIQKIDAYASKYQVMGLLVIKNGEIVAERYQYGRKTDMIFRGFSVSKTFTAMLVGIAHQKGFIKSLDDKVSNYWIEIKDSPYGDVTIKELLRMASGVESGGYDAGNSPLWSVLFKRENFSNPKKLDEYLNNIKSNGSKGNFRYSDQDTEILARVLVKSTNKEIATLSSEWLWQPMGGRGVGRWLFSSTDSIEQGSGGLIASMNDYGRFGVLLANDGKYKNTQVIPLNFLLDATDINKTPKSHLGLNTSNVFQYGYGYQTWVQPNKDRTFCALGHFGQIICVQPSSKIVMVQVAVEGGDAWRNSFGNMGSAINSLWENILKDLGGSTN
jgi:CubicO group peptidase (beta-lactamase class C family)